MDLREQSHNPNRHPWELSRADMVLKLLLRNGRDVRYADVGSGDLYFASRLAQQTNAPVYAVDVNYDEPTVKGKIRVCTGLAQVPSASIDCAVLMDVLEHVPDDGEFLKATTGILSPEGRVLITVPAHAFLWSEHDTFLGHYRRYDRELLQAAITRSGLEMLESFYFYALPFMARTLSVALARVGFAGPRAAAVAEWPFPPQHAFTTVTRAALNTDFRVSRFLGRNRWFRCGLSVCAICRRRSV
ncbi:MAG: methyltransferase domain-containing protein [Vicinamibacterales bacterium]